MAHTPLRNGFPTVNVLDSSGDVEQGWAGGPSTAGEVCKKVNKGPSEGAADIQDGWGQRHLRVGALMRDK